jgi:hypothetical protein
MGDLWGDKGGNPWGEADIGAGRICFPKSGIYHDHSALDWLPPQPVRGNFFLPISYLERGQGKGLLFMCFPW